jgi:hypothetical protein
MNPHSQAFPYRVHNRMPLHAPPPSSRRGPERIGRIAQPAILFDPAYCFGFGDEYCHCSRRQSGLQFFHREAVIGAMHYAKGSV